MINHIKYTVWELLTSLTMIADGLVGILTLGLYRGKLYPYIVEIRTSTTSQYNEDEDWDTTDDGVCKFFTGKRR